MVLPPLRVNVYLNGVLRSDVYCTRVDYGHGTAGATASLEIPSVDWDGGKRNLRGVRVRVDAGYDGAGPMEQVFLGYIWKTQGGTGGRMISFTAVSQLGLADLVYIGQGDTANEMFVEYPEKALLRGVLQETGWTTSKILRDIFRGGDSSWRGGGGKLPTSWRALLKLGSLTVLRDAYNEVPLGDVTFHQVTLRRGWTICWGEWGR